MSTVSTMSTSSTPTKTPSKGLTALANPKNLITLLITVILVVGEWRFGIVGGYDKLALTLGTCVLLEVALSLLHVRKWPFLQSAYISGISLTMLLRPAAGLYWPFVVGAALSIGSKYVLRYRERHLWNPSNFGIAALLLLAPSKVAILSHEFGNDVAANAVIWVLGLVIASRARVVHISITYAACFALLSFVRSLVAGTSYLSEVAPLTGPMYQLLVFFMLTDPRTTVGTRRGRIATVAAIAVVEALLRAANDLDLPGAHWFAPAPAILALFIVGPVALWLDLRSRQSAATGTRPAVAAPAVRPAPAQALAERD